MNAFIGRWLTPRRLCGAMLACAGLTGCLENSGHEQADAEPTPVPHVVTADIQAGIEDYIEQRIQEGGGYFRLSSDDRNLSLRLVRVHMEYLANLGPRRHFACVDLVDTLGDVYDVDFFLAGDPGEMTVTETTVHKLNGVPSYLWEQKKDRTWHRVPVEDAAEYLLGIIRGEDEFEFRYRVTLPEITGTAHMWLPLATTDSFQTIDVTNISAPTEPRVLDELEHGNKILFLELGPEDSGRHVEIRYHVRRRETASYAADEHEAARYLAADDLVPINENFRTVAQEVTAGKKTNIRRARAIYDHVIDHISYMKYGDGWGQGDAVYACTARSGNCTDFHAYFIGVARAAGIPARFAIGAAIPSNRNDGGVDGYHCWVEFYADGKWWPVDISEANKYTDLSTYYFGHHPANRLELSRGRDLVVEPGPASGPINFLAYPVLEIDGLPVKADVQFSFTREVAEESGS